MNDSPGGALLLVDLQRDFLARPGLEPHPEAVVAGAERWLREWRSAGRPVAHVLTRISRDDDRRMAHWKAAGLWVCERGTAGELPPECLAPREGEPVYYKSGYLPPAPGEIAAWARAHGAFRAILAGAMTHACVAHLAAALLTEGLEVAWAGGALGSDRPQAAAHVRAHLALKGVPEWSLDGVDEEDEPDGVQAAVTAGRTSWAEAPPAWDAVRPALLSWRALIQAAAPELAREITAAIGKPIAMARAEVRHSAALIDEVVRWRDGFQESRLSPGGAAVRRPLGVIAVLTPWNNPLSIPVGRIAPALAYGNAVVWKPAPAAGPVSDRLLELARRAGFGEVMQRCRGGGATGQSLAWHAGIDGLTFSGSLGHGRMVLAAASERLVPCQLEMGGNNAAVVMEDTDPGAAAEAVLSGAFGFAGQRCTANRRVIVLSGALEAFLSRVHDALDAWTPQDPFAERCRIGPVVDAAAVERIESVLRRAASRGARVTRAREGGVPQSVPPAIVEGVGEDSEIVREETFGPVLVVQQAADWPEAMRLLNAVPQGLVGALFSRSEVSWEAFRQQARAGILRWNEATAGPLEDLPFGGWKASGWGGAEHAEANARFFTRDQAWVERRGAG